MNIYPEISNFCDELGITEFGVTTAQPFESLAERLRSFDLPGFCEANINKRIFPELTLHGAKSIACFLFPYKTRSQFDASGNISGNIPGEKRGRIVSGDVWLDEDYHVYIKRELSFLCNHIMEIFGGRCIAFCDTGPFSDKEIAVRSGLCDYGRNSLAMNKKYGSFFYIGYILTDLQIENVVTRETSILSSCCEGCEKCVKACPTGALSPYGMIEHTKCVSYISQKKGVLSEWEARMLGDTLYGCHICQNVCPANKKENFSLYIDLSGEKYVSNKEFTRKHGNTAMRFIGKKRYLRNVSVVLNNSGNRC